MPAVQQLPADNLPRSFYKAKTLGVEHDAELIGYEHPVIIENLQPAPLSPAVAPCADESAYVPPPPPAPVK